MAADTRPDKKEDTWSADNYQKTASFVYSNEFTAPVLTLLNAKPGEKIIDVGCGSGEVTLQIKQLVGETGVVVGTDSSESMVRSVFCPTSAPPPNRCGTLYTFIDREMQRIRNRTRIRW